MFDIQITEKKGIQLIDSKLLHKALEVRSYHKDWIRRRIENYSFEEGKDYYLIGSKLSELKPGPNRIDYHITLDMAKELAMLENNDIGKKARRYFIQCEKEFRSSQVSIEALRRTRKTLTDAIKDSDENERMHGHAYSTYTGMAYRLTGLSALKKQWGKAPGFRESLSTEDLSRVEAVEAMSKTMVQMGKQYDDIQKTLAPLFKSDTKKIGV